MRLRTVTFSPTQFFLLASFASCQDDSAAAPVTVVKNFNEVNDDGSYTFGYENSNGEFKVETKDTDGNVKGEREENSACKNEFWDQLVMLMCTAKVRQKYFCLCLSAAKTSCLLRLPRKERERKSVCKKRGKEREKERKKKATNLSFRGISRTRDKEEEITHLECRKSSHFKGRRTKERTYERSSGTKKNQKREQKKYVRTLESLNRPLT